MAIKTDTSDTKELGRAMFAEFLSMTLFIWVGCGTVMSSGQFNNVDGSSNNTSRLIPISMAFGFGAVVILYCIAGISGGHMNPAVTFFLMVIKKITPGRAACYMGAQFLGGIVGAIIIWASTSEGGVHMYNLGANHLIDTLNGAQGFLLEIMGTFILCITVLFTEVKVGGPTDGKPNLALLCIGLAIFIAHLALVPFTGCGINPARTFGPALVGEMVGHVDDSDVFFGEDVWIFYLGPLCGALLAAGVHFIFDDGEDSLIKDDRQSEL